MLTNPSILFEPNAVRCIYIYRMFILYHPISTHSFQRWWLCKTVWIRIVPPLLQAVAGSFLNKKESVPRCSIDLLRSNFFFFVYLRLIKYSTLLVELFDTIFWGFDFERINCPILIPHSFSTTHYPPLAAFPVCRWPHPTSPKSHWPRNLSAVSTTGLTRIRRTSLPV